MSSELRQRTTDSEPTAADSTTTTNPNTIDPKTNNTRRKRMAIAKRGLRSLSIAISLPLLITLANIYYFGTSDAYKSLSSTPTWLPPLWLLHTTCLTSAGLMGVSGWLVWAQGGFHGRYDMLLLFLGQFGLSLIWDPVVFKLGLNWVGLIVSVIVFGILFRCSKLFGNVSSVAGDLIKPCLAWAGFLGFVNLKLMLASVNSSTSGRVVDL